MNSPDAPQFDLGQHLNLAAGGTLSPAEAKHLAECPVCRALYDGRAPLAGQTAGPSKQTMHAVLADLKPVKPIAGPWQLAVVFAVVLLGVLALAVWWTGSAGFFALSSMAKMLMLSILGIGALLFCYTLAQRMIPGSLQRVPVLSIALALAAAFVFVVALLFHDVTDWKVLAMQRTCLWLGIGAAVFTAAVGMLVVRRGAWINRFATVVSVGALSGVSALLVLTVHCPILKASHILIWHGGAVLVAVLAALLVGRRLE